MIYTDDADYEHRYDVHAHGENETVECAYCGFQVRGCESCPNAPPADDDAAWEELAKEHSDGCEWVQTRAHQLRSRAEFLAKRGHK